MISNCSRVRNYAFFFCLFVFAHSVPWHLTVQLICYFCPSMSLLKHQPRPPRWSPGNTVATETKSFGLPICRLDRVIIGCFLEDVGFLYVKAAKKEITQNSRRSISQLFEVKTTSSQVPFHNSHLIDLQDCSPCLSPTQLHGDEIVSLWKRKQVKDVTGAFIQGSVITKSLRARNKTAARILSAHNISFNRHAS